MAKTTAVTEVTEEHKTALSKAKIQLMSKGDCVFFTTLAFALRYVWDSSIRTACVDGVTMRISPAFFLGLSPEERLFVIVHEAMHPALLHNVRLMGRNHDLFNQAADHVINLMLEERGFKMPSWVLKDQQFKGMGTEEVYNILVKNPPPPPMGGFPRPMDGDIIQMPGEPDAAERALQDILVQASIASKMANDKPGTIPGEIELFLDRLLNPKLPWHRILQKYLLNFAKNDYTFKKPNRRFFPQHHLPSLYSVALMDIAIAVDISGSVSDSDFLRFVTETASILKMMKPAKITLIQFDTELKSIDTVRNINELMQVKFTGRGGTYINPVINWANENKPQLLLVFTDGGFHFYSLDTKVKTLWLIHDNKQFNAPFGQTIHYEMDN